MDPEEDEIEKARRTKIMQFMTPRPGRTHNQKYEFVAYTPVKLLTNCTATRYWTQSSDRDNREIITNRLLPLCQLRSPCLNRAAAQAPTLLLQSRNSRSRTDPALQKRCSRTVLRTRVQLRHLPRRTCMPICSPCLPQIPNVLRPLSNSNTLRRRPLFLRRSPSPSPLLFKYIRIRIPRPVRPPPSRPSSLQYRTPNSSASPRPVEIPWRTARRKRSIPPPPSRRRSLSLPARKQRT